ncbi:MAG TPA: CidA/LrgA family protein [Rhizobiales bacterium]|nr:CidA/LrgA family protein [Hyphomicrobiales bacterium]
MLFYLTIIFGCQLAGEGLVTVFKLPIPGPVVGMALLFCGLMIKGGVPKELATVADTLLANLSLLFIPAGVGVMLHFRLIEAELVPITISVIGSTLLTIAVTALVMSWLGKSKPTSEKGEI